MNKRIGIYFYSFCALFQFLMAIVIKTQVFSKNTMDILAVFEIIIGILMILSAFILFRKKKNKCE